MIKIDFNKPYSEVLGKSDDGCRYRQGEYRFTADGKVIGDTIELEKAAKEKKMAELDAQRAAYEKEVEAMNVEIASIAEGKVEITPEPVAPAPVTPGVHVQASPNPTQQAPKIPTGGIPAGIKPADAPIEPAARPSEAVG